MGKCGGGGRKRISVVGCQEKENVGTISYVSVEIFLAGDLPFSLELERLNNFGFFGGLEGPVVENVVGRGGYQRALVVHKLQVEDGTAVRFVAHVAVHSWTTQTADNKQKLFVFTVKIYTFLMIYSGFVRNS